MGCQPPIEAMLTPGFSSANVKIDIYVLQLKWHSLHCLKGETEGKMSWAQVVIRKRRGANWKIANTS